MNHFNNNVKRTYFSKNPLKNVCKGIAVILLFTTTQCALAQVGVGNTNPQATLDISASSTTAPANDDGILIPRMNAFPSTPGATRDGMLIFYTGTGASGKGFYYWDQSTTSWIFLSGAKRINDLIDGKSDNDGSNDGSSIFLGINAGAGDDSSNNENIGIGYQALENNVSGSENIAIGNATLQNSTASYSTALGYNALASNTTGNGNLALGNGSLFNDTTGDFNVAVGMESGLSNTIGRYNAYLGNFSGRRNITGSYNTFVGNISGNSIRGSNNVTIGHAAGGNQSVKNVSGSVFLGYFAGALEFASNRLYIENSSSNANSALIYGEFDNNILRTNSEFQIGNPTGTGYAFPVIDGSANQVLSTNGSGQLSFVNPSSVFTDTDEQTIDNFSFNASTNMLTLEIEDDGIPAQTVNLSSLDSNDIDWYEEGTSNAPDNINDNIYTLGKVSLGTTSSTNSKLYVYENNTSNEDGAIDINNTINQTDSFWNFSQRSVLELRGSGTGLVYNNRSQIFTPSGQTTGANATVFEAQSSINQGSSNSSVWLYSGSFYNTQGNGKRTGVDITFSNPGAYPMTGTGDKIGYKLTIPSAIPGTHYGLHIDAQSSSGYAAYLIGRTSLGVGPYNRYLMPETDGSSNQIISTNGSGQLSFVDASTIFSDTDEQTIDNFSFNASTNELTLEIENDGIPAQTVNLSSLTDDDWTPVGADIERQTGDVYIGDTSGTDNDIYISNSIIDWDDNSYLINPDSESYVNEINFDAGSNTDPSIHFDADDNTGFFRSETDAIGFTSNGTARMQITSRGQIEFNNIGNSTFIGLNSGENDDFSNNQNIGLGDYTLEDNTSGQANVAIGYLSMRRNTTGASNVGLGYGTLFSNTTGDFNVALGRNALSSNVGGLRNIGIGNQSLSSNISGNDNVAIGYQSLINTTGNYNIAIGYTAGANITTGTRNIAIGYRAQAAHSTGNDNIVLGDRAMDTSTNSTSNVAIGRNALTNMTEGNNNIAIGQMALGQNVGASPNAANNNVAIGHQAGQNAEGDANVYIGYQAGINDGVANNHLYIENSNADETAALIYGEFDNDILRFNGNVGIGRAPATNALEVNGQASKSTAGAFIANSDRRLKTNIKTISGETALQKLLSLRGVSYEWNDNQTETIRPDGIQYGFVAQELMEVFPEKVSIDNLGFYQTAYGDYDPFFVQAIKELKEEVDALVNENANLKAKLQKLESLEARLTALENKTDTTQTNKLVSQE